MYSRNYRKRERECYKNQVKFFGVLDAISNGALVAQMRNYNSNCRLHLLDNTPFQVRVDFASYGRVLMEWFDTLTVEIGFSQGPSS